MRLSDLFTVLYVTLQARGVVFFDVFIRWCSQTLTTGYHSAFNYLVYVDR